MLGTYKNRGKRVLIPSFNEHRLVVTPNASVPLHPLPTPPVLELY